jgi:hypothetical protein
MIGMIFGTIWVSRSRHSELPESRARLDEAGLAPDIRLGPRHPGVEREIDDRGGDHDVGHGIAECGYDAHGEHEERKGHDRVGDAPDNRVDPAAEEAGGDAGEPAEQEDERDRGDSDGEVEPRCGDHPAEDIAAELVGAEPVGRASAA